MTSPSEPHSPYRVGNISMEAHLVKKSNTTNSDSTDEDISSNDETHEFLYQFLDIEPQDKYIFYLLVSLCDRKTQPSQSETQQLSLDLLTDAFIAIAYLHDEEPGVEVSHQRFKLSITLYKFLLILLESLGPSKEAELDIMGFCYDELWDAKLKLWTPKADLSLDFKALKLCYLMTCILMNSLRKLFIDDSGLCNMALNPYMHKFLEIWKLYSVVVYTCLQIDRRLEEEDADTPDFILEILKGASLVRYVLAFSLSFAGVPGENSVESLNYEDYDYVVDTEEVSLETFYEPVHRTKANGGAMTKNVRRFELLRFILNAGVSFEGYDGMHDEGHLMGDRYDEDVRYIFDGFEEADEYDENDSFYTQGSQAEDAYTEGQPDLLENAVSSETDGEMTATQFMRRYTEKPNSFYLPQYFEQSRCEDDHSFIVAIYQLLYQPLDLQEFFDLGQKILTTIAYNLNFHPLYILNEEEAYFYPSLFFDHTPKEEVVNEFCRDNLITPIFSVSLFDLIVAKSQQLAACILYELSTDAVTEILKSEMNIKAKYNQKEIAMLYFLKQPNLSMGLIGIVFDMLNKFPIEGPFKLSGSKNYIDLNDEQRLIAAYQFFSAAQDFLDAMKGINFDNGVELRLEKSTAKNLVTLICLMIQNSTLAKPIFRANSEFIRSFLFPFLGLSGDARSVYFELQDGGELPGEAESFKLPEYPVDGEKSSKDHYLQLNLFEDLTIQLITLLKGFVNSMTGEPNTERLTPQHLEALKESLEDFPTYLNSPLFQDCIEALPVNLFMKSEDRGDDKEKKKKKKKKKTGKK